MDRKKSFLKISTSKRLPTPSRVALEVMRLCHSDSASLNDVANIIQTDPALSAELLKYANSYTTSTGLQATSVSKAAVKLGMKTIVNLALGFSLLSHNRNGRCLGFDYEQFWSTSLARAIAAKQISREVSKFDPEELFICGLLSHIGKLTLASVHTDKYSDILIKQPDNECLAKNELNNFGITNAELTTELFLRWGLPEKFALAAGCHDPAPVDDLPVEEDTKKLAKILQLANGIANICQSTYPQPQMLAENEQLGEQLAIQPKTFGALFDTIISRWQEWGELFKIPTQSTPLYHEIKAHDSGNNQRPENEQLAVLIADDDPLTVLNLEKLIRENGHRVITAENGEEALKIAIEQQPQLIVTDWKMPGISGLELCKILRASTATQHIYIIMVTSLEDDDAIVKAFEAGADDYVAKPFTPKVLEARIRGGERIIRYQSMLRQDRQVIQNYTARLSNANQRLQTMAMTDALTGLPNRRYAMERIEDAIKEAKRHNEPLSCIMLDLDEFKGVNDRYGHHAGDRLLQEVANIFKCAARNYDTICRMGGEEFLIISSRNDAESTRLFAERLRNDIENNTMYLENITITVTASFGVAQWDGQCTSGDKLIHNADQAMYRAKTSGKNRVEVLR